MATATPVRVTDAPRIAADPEAMEQLRDGLANAEGTAENPGLADLSQYDRERASFVWEQAVVDEAIAEISPVVAAMLEAAIAKRLPWTWEPER